jgi:tetratricopeptide (TPR) repeat protein
MRLLPRLPPGWQRRPLAIAVLLVASFAVELLALALIPGPELPQLAFWQAAAAHLFAAGLAAEALWLRGHGAPPALRASLLRGAWFLCLAFPVVGVVGCAVLTLRAPVAQQPGARAESLEAARSRAAAEARERRRKEQDIGADVDSLADALTDRDVRVRIAAVDALRGQRSPRAVRLLADARDNTVYDVRIRAVEGLGRISGEYGDRINTARRALERHPRAPVRHHELAALLLEYANLKLEEAEINRSILEEAVRHARSAIEHGHPGCDSRLVLGHALLELGDFTGAEQVFRGAIDLFGFDRRAFAGLAQAQFLRKDFDALSRTSRWVLRQSRDLEASVRDAVHTWVSRGHPVRGGE